MKPENALLFPSGEARTEIDLEDGRMLNISITDEGIIMDVYQIVDVFDNPNAEPVGEHTEHVGTAGMMFDEWADWVVDADKADDLTNKAGWWGVEITADGPAAGTLTPEEQERRNNQ